MLNRFTLAFLALGLSAAVGLPLASADEIDDLLAKLKPEPRFKDYKAKWSTKIEEVTFQGKNGPETIKFWFIRDGESVMAIMPLPGFHTGTIYVQDFRPGKAPAKVAFPKERWHIDTAVGTELRTNNFIPEAYGATPESYQWKVDGEKLVLTREYKGETAFERWAHSTKGKKVKVDSKNTITFLVHPQLGYVVDATYDIWTDQPPGAYEYSSATTSGRYLLFPGQATCYRHAITRPGSKGIIGYACNHGCTKQHGTENLRDGGFVSFLNDETGWSPTLTLTKGNGDAKLGVCGAHTDLDYVLQWPRDAEVKDGLKHNGVVRLRMHALPPELTKYAWDNMELLHKGETKLMIQMGVLEDFENQPLDISGRLRGMLWNATVSEKFAHSGKKSITFTGVAGHGDPQIALKPDTKYVCEAWLRVVDFTDEERKAADEAQRAAIEKAKAAAEAAAKRGKKPGAIPEFKPAGASEAWISGWTYEWSPHVDKPAETCKSNVVKASEQWQKVSFELTTPNWGPFIQLSFHAQNCTVYLDDFKFAEAK